jgi:hypothetical protein
MLAPVYATVYATLIQTKQGFREGIRNEADLVSTDTDRITRAEGTAAGTLILKLGIGVFFVCVFPIQVVLKRFAHLGD